MPVYLHQGKVLTCKLIISASLDARKFFRRKNPDPRQTTGKRYRPHWNFAVKGMYW
jgi:hypothetical protein